MKHESTITSEAWRVPLESLMDCETNGERHIVRVAKNIVLLKDKCPVLVARNQNCDENRDSDCH